jgi:hypothetical protein
MCCRSSAGIWSLTARHGREDEPEADAKAKMQDRCDPVALRHFRPLALGLVSEAAGATTMGERLEHGNSYAAPISRVSAGAGF